MMFSPGCGCCGTACGTICVRPVGCIANDIHSVPISATGSGTVTGSPCTTSGTVSTVTRTAAGGGYTSAPTVSFAAGEPPGSGATGHCVMSTTNVDHLVLTAGGTSFTTAPTVTITGDGFGATATAALNPSAVATVTRTAAGSGYTNGLGKSLAFTGGGGTGAAGTYDVVGGAITNLVLTNGGANYTTAPTVGFASAGPGTGASATAGLTPGPVATLTLVNHGSGYNNIPGVTFSGGGGGSGAIAAAVLGTRTVTSIAVDSGGSGYTEGSASFAVTLSGGGGSGAAGNANVVSQCCLGISAAGTYSVVMTAPSGTGFVDTTVSVVAGCTTQTIGPTFAVSSLYACTGCSGYPVKKAPTLTIGGTAHTLTFGSNSGGVTTWTASFAVSTSPVYTSIGGVISCAGGGSSTVSVTLRCNSGQWELSYGWNVGRCGTGTGGNSTVTGHGGCGNWYPVGTASDAGVGNPISTPTIVAAAAPTSTPLSITFPAFPANVGVCCCPADDLTGNYGFDLPNLLTGSATLTE